MVLPITYQDLLAFIKTMANLTNLLFLKTMLGTGDNESILPSTSLAANVVAVEEVALVLEEPKYRRDRGSTKDFSMFKIYLES